MGNKFDQYFESEAALLENLFFAFALKITIRKTQKVITD
jgi:hypothetical protein